MGKAMKVANTKEDISKLVETLKSHTINLIVLEATGG
jgi:transposase